MTDDTPTPVFETDGPPQAYFEVSDGQSTEVRGPFDASSPLIMRFVYRTIRCTAETEDAARKWMDDALTQIREWCAENGAFIVWRHRPSFEFNRERYDERPPTEEELDKNIEPELVHTPAYWVARCRLITSWPMPEELWARFEVKEGEPSRKV